MLITATYDPADDKIRISASQRLDTETYARVKAAGYGWAPKQGVFYAVWSPNREDLALELAGEIDDEDTTLVDRAEQRAERFEGYRENRTEDANRAHAAVSAICDGIPLGQPILVGHHSERHARKDAERIENGMRKAVKMWDTAQYWQSRAAGAIRNAKYKELPGVRARRIKGLEAAKRSEERDCAAAEKYTKLWRADGLTHERARAIANFDHANSGTCYSLKDYPRNPPVSQYEGAMGSWSALGDTPEQAIITPEQARDMALRAHAGTLRRAARWLQHINNRLEYERAMLAEGGGLKADGFDIQVGGRVQRRGEWFVVIKLNKRAGVLASVTVSNHWCTTIQIEEVQDYKAPQEGDTQKVEAAIKPLPLCNFRTDGCIEMNTEEWKTKSKWGDALAVRCFDANGGYHWQRDKNAPPLIYRHRSRYYMGDHITGTKVVRVFLTDAKITNAPAMVAPRPRFNLEMPESEARAIYRAPESTKFDAMRESLKVSVQAVSAPQLFPTPSALAARVVDVAGIKAGHRVLEPSAGTGALLDWIFSSAEVVAVEINQSLADRLRAKGTDTRCADFLSCNGDLGKFDRVIMNPPFANGADIKHITHAVKFLKPRGRLVAICANGPRQREQLMPLAEQSGGYWEDLPAGSFESQGTGVNTALVVIEAGEVKETA